MKRSAFIFLALVGALFGGACAKNDPLGSSNGGPAPISAPCASIPLNNGTNYAGLRETINSDTLYAPSLPLGFNTMAPTFGGKIQYSWGFHSEVAKGSIAPATVAGGTTCQANATGSTQSMDLWQPLGGIGGVSGDPCTDYFLRYQGYKGTDASCDFSSTTFFFKTVAADAEYDISRYRGFTFFARGKGNFGVSVSGNNTGMPYSGYNFFTKMFGTELSETQWKQFTVVFTDMVQLYGQAADLKTVLKHAWGLQFNQEPPIITNFSLDIDYIQFFK